MTAYQLASEATEVARIRPVGSESVAALAWFKVVWRPGSHEAETVHIYGPGLAIRDRQWIGEAPLIATEAVVMFCDYVERTADVVGVYDWAGGSVETSSG